MASIESVDLSLRVGKQEELSRLAVAQRRLAQLRLVTAGLLGGSLPGPPICVVMEGWDASGKGGAIRRLVAPLDIRHYRIAFFAKPTAEEKSHQYLWRFWPALPGWGDMTVFDRSWYGRVLVERVESLATESQWRRAYEEIVAFETELAEDGAIIVKFWLEISDAEQLARFERRRADPLRAWKLNDEDWRNRSKRTEYESALRDMIERTDHDLGPWDVVSAECKRHARVSVVETVVARIESGMRRQGLEPPPPLPPPSAN
ncbi:MAG: UDP-galactose-lipid carrier transferase [Actinomycetota bacterium]|nr:UDP-galactose-lipid carrier transferase [Actinomycetota bacterium]